MKDLYKNIFFLAEAWRLFCIAVDMEGHLWGDNVSTNPFICLSDFWEWLVALLSTWTSYQCQYYIKDFLDSRACFQRCQQALCMKMHSQLFHDEVSTYGILHRSLGSSVVLAWIRLPGLLWNPYINMLSMACEKWFNVWCLLFSYEQFLVVHLALEIVSPLCFLYYSVNAPS